MWCNTTFQKKKELAKGLVNRLAPNSRYTHYTEWCSKCKTSGKSVGHFFGPLMQPSFKFWSTAHSTRYLILHYVAMSYRKGLPALKLYCCKMGPFIMHAQPYNCTQKLLPFFCMYEFHFNAVIWHRLPESLFINFVSVLQNNTSSVITLEVELCKKYFSTNMKPQQTVRDKRRRDNRFCF